MPPGVFLHTSLGVDVYEFPWIHSQKWAWWATGHGHAQPDKVRFTSKAAVPIPKKGTFSFLTLFFTYPFLLYLCSLFNNENKKAFLSEIRKIEDEAGR